MISIILPILRQDLLLPTNNLIACIAMAVSSLIKLMPIVFCFAYNM